MNIAIQSHGLVLTESLRAYVHRRLQTALGWALTRRLAVLLSDINGPRGGRDKRCKIQIHLDHGKTIVIEDTEEDVYAAIDLAAGRADRALARQLSRGRKFTHDKARTLSPADEASEVDDQP
ncbi:ribosomal subunit interface protein [Duganella sp. 1224]|uniref:HPF/RaiA family ribosome-associated protein n=1 Tax=Duganella sp. 1224 TaxID=2587052 RepID=UPI0015C8C82C|nr:HPF/RaiA family ribosome-associated protein [Duganella sp. 1224]NYE61148.1 ribosomal subunit interface protein [Duganella sp. 1224]